MDKSKLLKSIVLCILKSPKDSEFKDILLLNSSLEERNQTAELRIIMEEEIVEV